MNKFKCVHVLMAFICALWIATIAPSQQVKDEPMEREHHGDELAREGKNDEALAEYLWCFDHGLEHDEGYYGVRLSFLLSDIKKLGETYPPALDALKTRLDAVEKIVLAGDATRSQAHDFVTLCAELGQPRRAITALDKLKGDDAKTRDTRATLTELLSKELAETGEYKQLVESMGNVPQWVDQHLDEMRVDAEELAKDKSARGQYTAAKMATIAMRRLMPYYEALVATNDRANASKLSDGILKLQPETNTLEWLEDSARRAGAADLADEFQKRAASVEMQTGTTKAR